MYKNIFIIIFAGAFDFFSKSLIFVAALKAPDNFSSFEVEDAPTRQKSSLGVLGSSLTRAQNSFTKNENVPSRSSSNCSLVPQQVVAVDTDDSTKASLCCSTIRGESPSNMFPNFARGCSNENLAAEQPTSSGGIRSMFSCCPFPMMTAGSKIRYFFRGCSRLMCSNKGYCPCSPDHDEPVDNNAEAMNGTLTLDEGPSVMEMVPRRADGTLLPTKNKNNDNKSDETMKTKGFVHELQTTSGTTKKDEETFNRSLRAPWLENQVVRVSLVNADTSKSLRDSHLTTKSETMMTQTSNHMTKEPDRKIVVLERRENHADPSTVSSSRILSVVSTPVDTQDQYLTSAQAVFE